MQDLALAIRLEVGFQRLVEKGGTAFSRDMYLAWCQVVYIRKAMEAMNYDVPESDSAA